MPAGIKVAAFNCPNCGAAVEPDATSCRYCGSSIAVKVCPSCFRSIFIGMQHCPFCGASLASSTLEKASLKCPRCETNLCQVAVGKHTLHECVQCGGLWVDKTDFQDICMQQEEQEAVLGFRAEAEPAPAAKQLKPSRAYIPCPECRKLMNQKNFSGCSGVVLDWCRDHGSWFDKGELQQIVAFIRNGGLKKARDRDLARLQEEQQLLRAKQFEIAVQANRTDSSLAGAAGLYQNEDPFLRFLSQFLSPK